MKAVQIASRALALLDKQIKLTEIIERRLKDDIRNLEDDNKFLRLQLQRAKEEIMHFSNNYDEVLSMLAEERAKQYSIGR